MYKEILATTEMVNGQPCSETIYTIQGVVVTREKWLLQLRINSIPSEIEKLQDKINSLRCEYSMLTND